MSFSVTMPALGESVSEGTVTRWLKQEGDQVQADEPLLEVSTDKVDTEVPSPASGVLQRIVVGEDETVAVGAELAVIGDEAAGGGDGGGEQPAGATTGQPAPVGEPTGGTPDAAPDAGYGHSGEAVPGGQDGVAVQQGTAGGDGQGQQGGQQGGGQQGGGQQGGGQGANPQGGSGTPVTMPALGESVSEGTVTRWLKQVGEQVNADEPLLEVSTDKVDTEVPSPVSGTLLSISVGEDETVPVGAELAVIGDASAAGGGGGQPAQPEQQAPQQAAPEQAAPQQQAPQQAAPQQAPQQAAPQQAPQQAAPQPAQPEQQAPPAARAPEALSQPAQPPAPPAPQPAAPQQPAAQQQAPGAAGDSPYVTPLVRKLAAEHDVDLSSLQGTGVGGRIRKQDVLAAAEAKRQQAQQQPAAAAAPAAAPAATAGIADVSPLRGTTVKMSRLRKVIAQRMVESLQVSAQLTTVVEVDVTKIARLRQRAKNDFEAREGVKLSFLPFFAKAAVEALKAYPVVNASIEGDTIVYHAQENLGIAVDTERGLLVPVIRDAGDLNLGGLSRKIADLAARTRNNKITPDELGGGTFTLTNTGSRGALFDTPIINQPQVAILGTGTVVKRPVVIDSPELGETIAVRSMMYLALSYDHRIVDGADAARFLVSVKQRLEEGAFEADLGL